MSERKIFRPGATLIERRKEWVALPDGFEVWVWELTVAESAQITDRSKRPAIDPRGGHDTATMIALQVMLSCYDGDEPGAKRIFGDADFSAIYELPFRVFDALLSAINRVNGKDAVEAELLRDFTAATAAQKTAESATGASST